MPAMFVSDDGFTVVDADRLEPGVHEDLMQWCRDNGLDPFMMPAAAPVYIRSDRIEYTRVIHDEEGNAIFDGTTIQTVKASRVCTPTPLPPSFEQYRRSD